MLSLHSISNRNLITLNKSFLHCIIFKLHVIDFVAGSGPNCSYTQSEANGTIITCTTIFADIPPAPMNAVIVCTDGGQVYTGPATKWLISSQYYLYNATTLIQISNSSAVTYDCRATFTPPNVSNNPSYAFIVTKEPT